ncbi:MAG: proteasome assembly chaperone family protein [Thaumarchaeota archaeon]|nr:proteasome assembly chaperone family protein [Nitrososphaerota archaeon]MBI3023915.1 proteasome assembly chaperone family protein [Nitrososphaerota archaeon]
MTITSLREDIEVREKGAPVKLRGGVVIEGFPGAGLASTIASSCLIASLNLSLVGELWSDHFPSLATIMNGQVQAPARIYADLDRKLAVFIGDFVPGRRASHVLARTIIQWARRRECSFVLTSSSIPMEQPTEEHLVVAVGNNSTAEEMIRHGQIQLVDLGAVGGVAGQLLLEGREVGIPVVALLVRAHKGIQDFKSGLKLAEAIMRLVPSAQCDLEAIRGEAERAESNLRQIRNLTEAPDVYR